MSKACECVCVCVWGGGANIVGDFKDDYGGGERGGMWVGGWVWGGGVISVCDLQTVSIGSGLTSSWSDSRRGRCGFCAHSLTYFWSNHFTE